MATKVIDIQIIKGSCSGECRVKSLVKFDVLIVGGGFSGTMLAVQLLRQSSGLSIGIVDRGSSPGRGLAYCSPYRFHLLNIPAGEMSALPDDADSFVRWARIHFDAGTKERSFLPRSVYGSYLEDLLDKALGEKGPERFRWVKGQARLLRSHRAGLSVETEMGSKLRSRVVVLATGKFWLADLPVKGLAAPSPAFYSLPSSPGALKGLGHLNSILLLGSGLKSLDLIMALKAKGFRGTIHVLSAKGLFPQARRQVRPCEQWTVFWNKKSPRTVRGLLRLVRAQIRFAAERGVDWRAVIDSLRPVTEEIWRSLPLRERRRFLRHVRVYWDAHRHRVAPEIADLLADMCSDGQVRLHCGVLISYSDLSQGAAVTLRDRETQCEQVLKVDRVINCTDPDADCRHTGDSLVSDLFSQGLARPNPLFLGLDAGNYGSLINHESRASSTLYAIGPPLKGSLWETTSVREIRQQAFDLAQHLRKSLEGDDIRQSLQCGKAFFEKDINKATQSPKCLL